MATSQRTPLIKSGTQHSFYVHDSHRFFTRRRRAESCLQFFVFIVALAMFTMALVVTISYAVSHSNDDTDLPIPNTTPILNEAAGQVTGQTLKLGLDSGFAQSTFSSSTNTDSSIPGNDVISLARLTDEETKVALLAGRKALQDRESADAQALKSPLSSPSPESRHRYAVSTNTGAGTLALAAVAEIAATKKIESVRTSLGEPSSIGSYFDGGWAPKGTCKGFLDMGCTSTNKYRTFDGSCNRLKQQGASMMPYRRALPPDYADGIDSPRKAKSGGELPSAREVSLKVHKPSPSTNPSFTVMLAVFGQFLDHDITATAISQGVNGSSISCCPPSVGHPECYPVSVGPGDPIYDMTGKTCMEFVRSAPAPSCKLGPREQLNQVTSFIDGSAIYGSDMQVAHSLREFVGGRLRMQTTPDNRTLLPASLDLNAGCNTEEEKLKGRYCFVAGDARANENLHLTTMHLIWARQHNRVADQLAMVNPTWSDEKVYQESRRIVGAQLQHITYQELIPIIVGEQETDLRGMKPLDSGYRYWSFDADDSTKDPTIANHFAAAVFRFAHTLLPGLMMMTDAQKGTTSYIELHRMLFNPYSLYSSKGVDDSVISATSNVVQETSTHVTSQLTRHLFEDPFDNNTVPCGLDLVSLNIQRGRDHGLPGYVRWREYCGLGRPESFADLEGFMNPDSLDQISQLYESVDDIDLYTGALAEIPISGGLVGPTFTCLISDQFVRLQRGDRYWYELYGEPQSFTEDQLRELRKTTLAKVICDCSDGITQIQMEVMRSVDSNNPMISCEEVPKINFEMWKEGSLTTPKLKAAPPLPASWLDFKDMLIGSINDIVTYINTTRGSLVPGSADWLSFNDDLNSTFAQIRNQLAGLHPKKIIMEATPKINGDVKLHAAAGTTLFTDWITFKSELLKSLNDTIGKISIVVPSAANWITLQSKIKIQAYDLAQDVAQVASLKTNLTSKLSQKSPIMESNKNYTMEKAFLSAIFDWKNFKGDLLNSLDDAIMKIGSKMPPPDDPAWATFGSDIRDRFFALRDKLIAERPTFLSQMVNASIDAPIAMDWLPLKKDIIDRVLNAVHAIEAGMPAPGDLEWSSYRDKIMNSFAAFDSKFRNGTATVPSLKSSFVSTSATFERAMPGDVGKPKKAKKSIDLELSTLTDDWIEFRNQINNSIADAIEKIKDNNSLVIDPVGWIMFGNSIKNKFAEIKNNIIDIKNEWIEQFNSSKAFETVPKKVFLGKDKGVSPPIIPTMDWIAFKQEINDTIMNSLGFVSNSNASAYKEIHDMYNNSFAELKDEIVQLRDIINNSYAAYRDDWDQFRAELNSTVNDFIGTLQNKSQLSVPELLNVFFQIKEKFKTLEPPSTPKNILNENWASYFLEVNKTMNGALNSIGDLSNPIEMVTASEPTISSSVILQAYNLNGWPILVGISVVLNLIKLS